VRFVNVKKIVTISSDGFLLGLRVHERNCLKAFQPHLVKTN